jgi:uncharacterized protein YfaQ (DUF2300 family)
VPVSPATPVGRFPIDSVAAQLDAVATPALRAALVVAWQVARLAGAALPGAAMPIPPETLRDASETLRRWCESQPVSRDVRSAAVRTCTALAAGDPTLASAALESVRMAIRGQLSAAGHAELADIAFRLREPGRAA